MLFLFSDFGAGDLYVGQVKAVLAGRAPGVPVIDLLHEAPAFNVAAGAHLLAALAMRIPRGGVVLAVVDPGVGGPREAVAVFADGRWLVGPDNGLLSVTAARAKKATVHAIGWRPERLSASFHGRDLFAPVAAMLANGRRRSARLDRRPGLAVDFGAGDLAQVIYLDHYGNAITGLRAGSVPTERRVTVGGREIAHARVFPEVPAGALFWYENSLGLVEIAANGASAAELLGIAGKSRAGRALEVRVAHGGETGPEPRE
ncbi:MAG: SAM-dependent chlorinase/fluorinase [Burkholderiales bacterium]|nr:SAM-dependent chlorinase/fluorinase [Burkholderiales bacterium]